MDIKDHVLHIFKDFGLVVKMFTKNIFPTLAQGSSMDQVSCRAMTISCRTVLAMDISAGNGNGLMENHGITLIGTMASRKMKDQTIV